MKKIFSVLVGFIFLFNTYGNAEEKLSIEKQLVGVVGAISGTVKTETRELKAGDKIYLNETIYAGASSGTQILCGMYFLPPKSASKIRGKKTTGIRDNLPTIIESKI